MRQDGCLNWFSRFQGMDMQTALASVGGILSDSSPSMKNPVLKEQGVQEDLKWGEG